MVWGDVEIPDVPDTAVKPGADDAVAEAFTGALVSRSEVADPNDVTYKNALVVSEFRDSESGEVRFVKEWAFRDKVLTPAANREIGEVVSFSLIPFDGQSEVKGEQEFDDYVEQILETRWWPVAGVETARVEGGGGEPGRATMFAVIACVVATVLVVGVLRRVR